MTALEWYEATHLDGTKGIAANSDKGVRFFIRRHGEGRKYWGVTYPDGTYTHNALTQAEAKKQAESWKPDPELVALVDVESDAPDASPATDVAASAPADLTAAAVVSAIIDAASSGPRLPRQGWGYQDAGERQQIALNAIRALAELRSAIDEAIREQVAIARTNTGNNWYSNAATWQHVGQALGVTKQSAQAKYGKAS